MSKFALVFNANGGYCVVEDAVLGTFDDSNTAFAMGANMVMATKEVDHAWEKWDGEHPNDVPDALVYI